MVQLNPVSKDFKLPAKPWPKSINLINVLVITRENFIIISFFAYSVNKIYDILFALAATIKISLMARNKL